MSKMEDVVLGYMDIFTTNRQLSVRGMDADYPALNVEYSVSISGPSRVRVIANYDIFCDTLVIHGDIEVLDVHSPHIDKITIHGSCGALICRRAGVESNIDIPRYTCAKEYNAQALYPILSELSMFGLIKHKLSWVIQKRLLARKRSKRMILG